MKCPLRFVVDASLMTSSLEPEIEASPRVAKKVRRPPRRQYSRAYKLQLVREMLVSGASVSVVSRRHDVNANQLFRWRRQYNRGEWGEATDLVQVGVVGVGGLVVTDSALETCAPSATAPELAKPTKMIEVRLKGGSVIRLDADMKPVALRAVLKLIRSLA